MLISQMLQYTDVTQKIGTMKKVSIPWYDKYIVKYNKDNISKYIFRHRALLTVCLTARSISCPTKYTFHYMWEFFVYEVNETAHTTASLGTLNSVFLVWVIKMVTEEESVLL